jgi:hypothetical protein
VKDLVAVLVYNLSFWDEFRVNNSRITLPFDCAVAVSSFLAMIVISRWPIVASIADHTENTMFCLLL